MQQEKNGSSRELWHVRMLHVCYCVCDTGSSPSPENHKPPGTPQRDYTTCGRTSPSASRRESCHRKSPAQVRLMERCRDVNRCSGGGKGVGLGWSTSIFVYCRRIAVAASPECVRVCVAVMLSSYQNPPCWVWRAVLHWMRCELRNCCREIAEWLQREVHGALVGRGVSLCHSDFMVISNHPLLNVETVLQWMRCRLRYYCRVIAEWSQRALVACWGCTGRIGGEGSEFVP